MATTQLQLTYAEIRENYGMVAGISRDPATPWAAADSSDCARCIRNGLRKFYYAHEWSFLRPQAVLTTVAPYATGTVTVVNGVVTLAAGTFPSWAADAWFICGGRYYEVNTRDGDTQITLVDISSDNDIAAGTSYSLKQYRYDLPSDFESLAGPLFYNIDESTEYTPLERRSWEFLQQLYKISDNETLFEEPKFFAVSPKTHVATVGQRYRLMIWPAFMDVLHLNYRYKVTLQDLDGTSLYPPGGGPHSQTILEAILAEAELKKGIADGPHKVEYERCLADSITLDRQAATPATFGVARIDQERSAKRIFQNNDYVIPAGVTLADITS